MPAPIVTGQLFGRRCRVSIQVRGTQTLMQFEGLRVQFKIIKSLKPEPNPMVLQITNLSENSRNQMQSKGGQIIVEAGYTNAFGTIFSGNVRTIDHKREGADVVTYIQCGMGEVAYRDARANHSWAKGTLIKTAIKDLINDLAQHGVGPGETTDSVLSSATYPGGRTKFLHGTVAQGSTTYFLNKMLPSIGLGWSIQDGNVLLLSAENPVTTNPIYLLRYDTGLIGSPEHGSPDKEGSNVGVVKARTLLLPVMSAGQRVHLETFVPPKLVGDYAVRRAELRGDTAGTDWYCDLELTPSNAS